LITERTRFFIEHHMTAHLIRARTAPHQLRNALKRSPDYEDLLLLSELDQQGRQQGIPVITVDEALGFLKELERQNG
jgi:predicted O-methyltransferase YrrM